MTQITSVAFAAVAYSFTTIFPNCEPLRRWASASGTSPVLKGGGRMLRYYEGEGLLTPPRTDSGYRDYGAAEEETVRRIKTLGAAGMTLETIQQLLPCVKNNNPDFQPCDDVRRLLAQQVGLIDQRIETLSQSRTILAGFLSSVN